MTGSEYPLVSVAIVTYNQKKFLRECIESVLIQDYPNVEIVVADDGSTDGTHEMLLDYEKRYPGKFRLVLSKKNEGITANSNRAHFACQGKYIAWIGGDDLMLQGKLRKQVELMESHPDCDVCYHDLDVFDDQTGKTLYFFSQKNMPRNGDVRTSIQYGTFNGACSTMVRREKTPSYGFHPLLPVASDGLYWIETLMKGGKINYIPEVLGRYRKHEGNVTAAKSDIIFSKSMFDHFNACNILLQKYPEYFPYIMKRYAQLLLSSRRYFPYFSAMSMVFRMDPCLWKAGVGMLAYVLTFGKWKP